MRSALKRILENDHAVKVGVVAFRSKVVRSKQIGVPQESLTSPPLKVFFHEHLVAVGEEFIRHVVKKPCRFRFLNFAERFAQADD